MLKQDDRQRLLEMHGIEKSPEEYTTDLYTRVTKKCALCQEHFSRSVLAHKLLDAKLDHLNKVDTQNEHVARIQDHMERHFQAFAREGGKLRR